MSRPRCLPLPHPLAALFDRAVDSLGAALSPHTTGHYRSTVRNFLRYLGTHHPQVNSLDQLRREPHLLGWMSRLRSQVPPLATSSYIQLLIALRPPLTAEQDQLLQQEFIHRNDLGGNAFLLIRHIGMRIGECADLSFDCLRSTGPDQWAVHVPLGKLRTERMVPVDSWVVTLIQRLRFFRSLDPLPPDGRLLARTSSKNALVRQLRRYLHEVCHSLGLSARIVPHQLRHTYATEMLRAGVSFPALMKLLGHTSPDMTMLYVEVALNDLQREFQQARSKPRHLVPQPKTSFALTRTGLDGVIDSLQAAQHAPVMSAIRRCGRLGRIGERTWITPHEIITSVWRTMRPESRWQ
jgi:integrase